MNMLEQVIAEVEREDNADHRLSGEEKDIVAWAMRATLMQVATIVAATWNDKYPADLKPWQVKGRKEYRRKRLIERILTALPPATLGWIVAFADACGDVPGELEKMDEKPPD